MKTAKSTSRPNREIADLLFRMSELLTLQGASPYRAAAYRRAAIMIRNLRPSLAKLVAEGRDLRSMLRVGADLAAKIAEATRTGTFAALQRLEAETPPALATLSATPGLGPRRIRQLQERLGVTSVEGLRRALVRGDVRKLRGFGPAIEAGLEAAIRPPPVPSPPARES